MKARLLLVVFIGAITIFTASITDASRRDDGEIRTKISSQQRRIDRGVSSGELTRREARTLRDNLSWIRTEYHRALSDQVLSRRERRRIESHLDRNSEMIRMKKRNPVRRIY